MAYKFIRCKNKLLKLKNVKIFKKILMLWKKHANK